VSSSGLAFDHASWWTLSSRHRAHSAYDLHGRYKLGHPNQSWPRTGTDDRSLRSGFLPRLSVAAQVVFPMTQTLDGTLYKSSQPSCLLTPFPSSMGSRILYGCSKVITPVQIALTATRNRCRSVLPRGPPRGNDCHVKGHLRLSVQGASYG
jgi:hypothetical protein